MRLSRWNLVVAGIAASWGFVSVIAAGVDLPAASLVFWRCAIAAVAVPALVLVVRRLRLLVVQERRPQVVGLALLVTVHWALLFETLKLASVAVAILTADTIGGGLPSEDAYTIAFAMSSVGGLLAVGAALMVPPKADVAALAAEAPA